MLEAASADLRHDDGGAAFVFAGLRLTGDKLFAYTKNVKIAGRISSEDFEFLEPSAKEELNKIESARWHATLLEGSFSNDATQLAKDHTNYLRLSHNTARTTFKNPAALAKLIKFFPVVQKNLNLRKLLHDAGRTMSLVTNSKSTAKPNPNPNPNPKTKPYVPRTDGPPQPPPFHSHQSVW